MKSLEEIKIANALSPKTTEVPPVSPIGETVKALRVARASLADLLDQDAVPFNKEAGVGWLIKTLARVDLNPQRFYRTQLELLLYTSIAKLEGLVQYSKVKPLQRSNIKNVDLPILERAFNRLRSS